MPTTDPSHGLASPQHLTALALAALMAWLVYRRLRRNFGRQALRPNRLRIRIALLTVVAVLLALTAPRSPAYAGAAGLGALFGLALALWAVRRTRFENAADGLHYVPHTVTGVAVSALFLARLVYRMFELNSGGAFAGAPGPANSWTGGAPASSVQSPLTLGLFFVLLGYYIYYYGHVLWKGKHLTNTDIEDPAATA